MILQALKGYYDRKAADPNSEIAPEGFEKRELQFLIVISEGGEFISIDDLREKNGKKLVGKTFLLPRSELRSGSKSYETTFFLWDHIGYILGLPVDDEKSSKQLKTWIKQLETIPDELVKDDGVAAVIKFYERGELQKAINSPQIQECLKSLPCNMSFRLVSDVPVPCREGVQRYIKYSVDVTRANGVEEELVEKKSGICMVTGESGPIARKHGKTPINKDCNSLIGFQKGSGYDSYGKEQGYNAPIAKSTEFAYVTALNTLLKSREQKIQVGDASMVFWSEKKSSFESDFSTFFDEAERDDPDRGSERVKALYKSVTSGAYFDDDGNMKFFVLGLSPGGGSRISVRFWHVSTIKEFARHIQKYFEDFNIIKPPYDPQYYSVWRILVNIAVQGKTENIQPNLSGDFMRAILEGTPYPATLIQAALRRIHAGIRRKGSEVVERVTPEIAALLKAYLNRYYRFYKNDEFKEVTMGLDKNRTSIGYQLGRLFAVLEKIQEEANPGLNATIRDRFYGAASSTPVTVFGRLLNLQKHHLGKITNRGKVIFFEGLASEVVGKIDDFPAHLGLHEQGLFAIGYYHQRQDFYTKNEENKMEA